MKMKRKNSPIFSKSAFSTIELMVAIVVVSFVGILVQKVIKKTSSSCQKAKIQTSMDNEHFLALQKIRQTGGVVSGQAGALKSALASALDSGLTPGAPSEYAKFVSCLESAGTGCVAFHGRELQLSNVSTDPSQTLTAAVGSDLQNCTHPGTCKTAYSRNTLARLNCESDTTCSGIQLKIISQVNDDNLRKITSESPLSNREFNLDISSSELITPGLKGVCPDGMVAAINKATNKIECGSAEAVAKLGNLENICNASFDSVLGEAHVGVRDSGLAASQCQKIQLAKWDEASAWPSPKQSKPLVNFEQPLEEGIKTESEVPVVGDLYLIVDTSGSMAGFRKKMAEAVADIVDQTRANPNNSINIYLYPITAMDNESISNTYSDSTTDKPNSQNKLWHREQILKPAFFSILNGQIVSRSEVINKIENAPQPTTLYTGDSFESGVCAMLRVLTQEQDKIEKLNLSSDDRRKFFMFLTDEKDLMDGPGAMIKSAATTNCSHSSRNEYYPIVHAAKKETRYSYIGGWNNLNNTNLPRPTNADRKTFASYGAYLVIDYEAKTVSEDKVSADNPLGIVKHVPYINGPFINPSEYGIQIDSIDKVVNCPQELLVDAKKYLEQYAKTVRNQSNYYSTDERKNEEVVMTNCRLSPYGLGYYASINASEFSNREDFYDFDFNKSPGKVNDGNSFSNLADYLAKDKSEIVLKYLQYAGATRQIMSSATATDKNYYQYSWTRTIKVPVNEPGGVPLASFLLDAGKRMVYEYAYIHNEPEWIQWGGVSGEAVWTSSMQYFLNRMPDASGKVENAYTSNMKVSDLMRKSFDLVYNNNYAVTAIVPKENSTCVSSSRYSPLYKEIIEAMPEGRKSLVDICSHGSEYVKIFQEVLDFFSYNKRWDVKTYEYTVAITETEKASIVNNYFKDNPEARVVVVLMNQGSPERVTLEQDVDFKATLSLETSGILKIKIEFIKNSKNKELLLKYKNMQISFN